VITKPYVFGCNTIVMIYTKWELHDTKKGAIRRKKGYMIQKKTIIIHKKRTP